MERAELEKKGQKFLEELAKKMNMSNGLMKPCNQKGCVSGHFDTEEKGFVGFMLFNDVNFLFFGNKVTKTEQEIIKVTLGDQEKLMAYEFGEQRLPLEGDWSWKKMTEMAEGNLMLQGLLRLFAPGNK